ncbi:MAG: CopG family transcriptional regulator [Gomphosphaeria aponina SAG 52.96 = DSM 107014]|uniref:CopG family transcriptional regulator n=1 Tax=Gomphosphaeria aponina SAG 52.96 = DSM 107014 TaxID=1521640 RepID=A0A941JVF1_9CHRO|nr:CopG family transcriptional regulator [Gomphosphaeria aponina SAG 52.96 = DSM 107014]
MKTKILNVRITEQEMQILEDYAHQTMRTKSDLVREWIRSITDKLQRHNQAS